MSPSWAEGTSIDGVVLKRKPEKVPVDHCKKLGLCPEGSGGPLELVHLGLTGLRIEINLRAEVLKLWPSH